MYLFPSDIFKQEKKSPTVILHTIRTSFNSVIVKSDTVALSSTSEFSSGTGTSFSSETNCSSVRADNSRPSVALSPRSQFNEIYDTTRYSPDFKSKSSSDGPVVGEDDKKTKDAGTQTNLPLDVYVLVHYSLQLLY